MTVELWVSPSATNSDGWHRVTAVPGDDPDQTTICGLPVEEDAFVFSRREDRPAMCEVCQASRQEETPQEGTMESNVRTSIHLGSDFRPRICPAGATHAHLSLDGDAIMFFGQDPAEEERNLHALRDAVQTLIHQRRAERVRREALAQSVNRVASAQAPRQAGAFDWSPKGTGQ